MEIKVTPELLKKCKTLKNILENYESEFVYSFDEEWWEKWVYKKIANEINKKLEKLNGN